MRCGREEDLNWELSRDIQSLAVTLFSATLSTRTAWPQLATANGNWFWEQNCACICESVASSCADVFKYVCMLNLKRCLHAFQGIDLKLPD